MADDGGDLLIGVLALQGAFAEHIAVINDWPGCTAREIKQSSDMVGVDGLILPGGESTVQGKWLAASDLGDTLRDFCRRRAGWTMGTCAGFILLANTIRPTSATTGLRSEKAGGQFRLGGMDVEIERNYFGRQINSFEADLIAESAIGPDPFHAVFIRAPAVHEDGVGDTCRVLATVQHEGRTMVVAVEQDNYIGLSFHPELTTDVRWHGYFLERVADAKRRKVREQALMYTDLPGLTFLARGKVRDIYTVDADTLLFVTTDRISAYDVIMRNAVPAKGKILTALSEFWFARLSHTCAHHLITTRITEMPESCRAYRAQLAGRAMLVRKYKILPIEAIVRGYITGSAWKEYLAHGTVHGLQVPRDMRESQAFPEPLFTPSTKADQGEHDENIHPDRVKDIIGADLAERMAKLAVKLYIDARDYALTKGIIIADTKFEFGVTETGDLVLVDEVLTPDSSRFWPAAEYTVGRAQQSFDKQYLRDYLTSHQIDKQDGVEVPQDVIDGTRAKYQQVYERLTGKSWVDEESNT